MTEVQTGLSLTISVRKKINILDMLLCLLIFQYCKTTYFRDCYILNKTYSTLTSLINVDKHHTQNNFKTKELCTFKHPLKTKHCIQLWYFLLIMKPGHYKLDQAFNMSCVVVTVTYIKNTCSYVAFFKFVYHLANALL